MTRRPLRLTISMLRNGLCLFAGAIALSQSAPAQSAETTASQRPPVMDRQREIALALSACPASVATKAAVYVLEGAGYIKVETARMASQRSSSMRYRPARSHNAWTPKGPALSFHVI